MSGIKQSKRLPQLYFGLMRAYDNCIRLRKVIGAAGKSALLSVCKLCLFSFAASLRSDGILNRVLSAECGCDFVRVNWLKVPRED